MTKPRVSLISHAYLEESYRAKLPSLAESVDLMLVSPNEFGSVYGLKCADFSDRGQYDVQVYPCFYPAKVRTSTRWVLASRDLGLSRFRPDIIHVENEIHSFIVLQALICQKLFVPHAKLVVAGWANQELTGAKKIWLNGLARLLRPYIHFFITASSEGAALLKENGVPPGRVAVCPLNSVDVSYFKPASQEKRVRLRSKLGLTADEFVIGYVGRFIEDKGVLDLLEAFEIFQKQITSGKARLLCVGDGPLKQTLSALKPKVLVVSPGGSYKVKPYYQMMDVLVLPSRTTPHWKEQFGRVLVEAMACAVPVIGSNSGAIPEVIGNNYLIFPERNPAELAERLSQLRSDAMLSEIGRQGRQRVIDAYSVERNTEQLLTIYNSLATVS